MGSAHRVQPSLAATWPLLDLTRIGLDLPKGGGYPPPALTPSPSQRCQVTDGLLASLRHRDLTPEQRASVVLALTWILKALAMRCGSACRTSPPPRLPDTSPPPPPSVAAPTPGLFGRTFHLKAAPEFF